MAILDNFLFRLEGTRLSMTASDQETTMTTAIDVMEADLWAADLDATSAGQLTTISQAFFVCIRPAKMQRPL